VLQEPEGLIKELLDGNGEVQLVGWLGGDLTVVNSARVSFGKHATGLGSDDVRLILYLAKHGHTSPFRHVQLQFRVKAPEFVARQWYKHAVGGGFTDTPWNEISQRYTEVPTEFYRPAIWRAQKGRQTSEGGIEKQAHAHLERSKAYLYAKSAYERLLELGVAREQARLVLPLSVYTEWYWTTSLQAAAHFIKLRSDEHAQQEIRVYADAVRQLTMKVAPVSLAALLGEAQ
jgi:thymidylate synthase (FAD)